MYPAEKYLKGHYFFRGLISLSLPFVFAGLFFTLTAFFTPKVVFADVSSCGPNLDFYRIDYRDSGGNDIVSRVYSVIGPWSTGTYFTAAIQDCTNPPSPNNFCIGWKQNTTCPTYTNGTAASDPASFTWTGNMTQQYGPFSGGSMCVTAWLRNRVDGACQDNSSVYLQTTRPSLPVWNGSYDITGVNQTVTEWMLDHWIVRTTMGVSGGVSNSEYMEYNKERGGGFCKGIQIRNEGGLFSSCVKEVTVPDSWTNYTGTLCGTVAGQRQSNNCVPVNPTPTIAYFSCNVTATPTPVHPGGSTTLNTTVTNGTSPYTFSWSNPGCGVLSATDVQNPTWTAVDGGGAKIGGVACNNSVQVTDSNLLQTSCNVDVLVADFSLNLSPTSQTTCKGNNGIYQLTATAQNGWNKEISLLCLGVPTGATCFFSNNSNCSSNDGNKITPTGSKYVCVDTSSSTPGGTYNSIFVTGKVSSPGDPSDLWSHNSNYVSLTVSTTGSCVSSCTISKNPSSVYPGATSTLTAVPNPASPPSGETGYNYDWMVTPPSCGQFNPAEPVPPPETATWQAKSGSTFVAGVGCTNYLTVTDPGSGQSSSCNTNVDVYDFSLGVSPPIVTVNRGQSASYTVAALAINGWSRGVNLSIDSIKDENNVSYSCSDLANSCTFATNPIIPGGPNTTTLSFNTIKQTAPYHTYTIVVRGTDSVSGFYRDSNSFNLVITDAPVCAITPASSTVYPGESDKMNVTITGGSGSFSYSWTANCGRFSAINIKEPDWQALTSGGAFFSNSPSTTECYPTLTITDQDTSASSTCSTTVTERDFSMSLGSASATQGQICKHTVNAGAVSGWSKQIELSEVCPSGTDISCYYSLNSDCLTNNGTTMNVTPTATRYLCVSSSFNTPSGGYSVSAHGEVKSAGDPSNGFYHDASATCTFGCSTPNLPINLTVTPPPATESANVKWDPPASGPAPSSYGIQWAESSAAYSASVNTTSNTYYNITNIEANTCYKWRVRSQVTCSGSPFYSNWADGPEFCTSAVFSCYVNLPSGTVAPGKTIDPVTTLGSGTLSVTSWSASCGVLSSSAPTNPVVWTAKNAFGADLPDKSVCDVNSNADTDPAGQSASCTKATYTVAATKYCCGINLACRECVVGDTQESKDKCAGRDLGAWCGSGGPSYDLACKGFTSDPSPCTGAPGSTCSLTAKAGGHGIPYVYRFQSVPIVTPTPALEFMNDNNFTITLASNYNTNNNPPTTFRFQSPFAQEMYLDKVEVKLKPLLASDGISYIGAPIYAAILETNETTLLAEAGNTLPNGDQERILTFDFAVEPKIVPNHWYKLGVIGKGVSGSSQAWMAQKTTTEGLKHTRKFYFRDPVGGEAGGFTTNNPSDYVCFNPGDANSTCNMTYKLPTSATNPKGYKISFEVAATDDITYNCGGAPNGCFAGRATESCSILGKSVTVTADAWWQGGIGGDVYGRAGLKSSIPAAPTPYLIAGEPGIAMSGTSQLETNGRDTSTSNWRVTNYTLNGLSNPDTKGYSYNYFYNKLKDRVTQTIDAGDPKLNNLLANLGGSPNPSVTLVNTNVTISSSAGYDGGTAVVLVNGDLAINKNVPVGDTSALIFIVDGNITIDPSVTRIDGVYFAKGVFSTGSSNNQLIGNGAWLVSPDGQFNLERDLGANNTTTPAEKVNFEPKYLLKLMDILGEPNYIWQEVAG